MASLAAIRTLASRRVAPRLAIIQTQRRNMALGGHHGPAPEWTGIDKVVRSYVPEDWQLAIAILGGYTSLFVVYKVSSMFSSKKPTKEAAPAASSAPSSEGIPSVESPEFVTFLESDAFVKLLDSEDQLKALTD